MGIRPCQDNVPFRDSRGRPEYQFMELDIAVEKGSRDKPVVILIHGLGMDKNIWIDPLSTKIFARNIPLKIFAATAPKISSSRGSKKISIGTVPKRINTLWSALKCEGFNIICWSQRNPVGPIGMAVEELSEVVGRAKRIFSKIPLVLIGHSRGGLVARKFMEKKSPEIKALITISAPHAGSSIAQIGKYLKPFSFVLKSILPKDTHGKISKVIKNITDLLEGNALKELFPGSEFFENLRDLPQKGVTYVSFGGTDPRLFTIYAWKKMGKKVFPRALLSIPDSLIKIFPSFLVVDEITPGKGDGLVSVKSSLLPWASKHYNFRVNHVSVMWSREAINKTMEILKAI